MNDFSPIQSQVTITENNIEHTISYDRPNGVHIDLAHIKATQYQGEHVSFMAWSQQAREAGTPDKMFDFPPEEWAIIKRFANDLP